MLSGGSLRSGETGRAALSVCYHPPELPDKNKAMHHGKAGQDRSNGSISDRGIDINAERQSEKDKKKKRKEKTTVLTSYGAKRRSDGRQGRVTVVGHRAASSP